jgi:UDP-N-acetylglucosamine 1-carboxyvinyltransferase
MATENIVMAASLGEGETTVGNAACEPHVQDLCRFLGSLGARIEGIESNVLRIEGVESLRGGEWTIGPDHVEVASFIGLAAVTGGDLTIDGVKTEDLISILPTFARLGVRWRSEDGAGSRPAGPGALHRGRHRRVHPEDRGRPVARVPVGLHVDRADGRDAGAGHGAPVREDVREPPVLHGQARLDGRPDHPLRPHRAVVTGPTRLRGQRMESPDIRAGMSMLLASLCAEGESTIGADLPDRQGLRADRRAAARARAPHRARPGLANPTGLSRIAAWRSQRPR